MIIVIYDDDDRAVASQKRLAELNPYVTIDTMTQPLDGLDNLDFLQNYQASGDM